MLPWVRFNSQRCSGVAQKCLFYDTRGRFLIWEADSLLLPNDCFCCTLHAALI